MGCCCLRLTIPTATPLNLGVLPPPPLNIGIGSGGVRDNAESYSGEYIITPLAFEQTILETNGKIMRDDVTVLEIPYYRSSNPQGGDTIFIGYSEG